MQGKTVLITGADGGIGRETTKALARKGATIIMACIDLNYAKPVYEDIIEESGNKKIEMMQVDLASLSSIREFTRHFSNRYQQLNVLINNAGVIRDKSFLKMTRQDWDVVMTVNVDSLFVTSKAVIPHMKVANYGRIISASSINAYVGAFGQTNYSASKAAIVGFTHSLCREVGKYNITVNAVAPGFIKSEMTDSMPDEVVKAGIEMIPVKRIGTPEDMGYAYLFLASKEAGFISGHTLHANGGSLPV